MNRVAWFDQLPAGWRSTQLRHVARIFAGGTPDRKRTEFWSEGTVPWLNSGAVNQDVITEPSEFITPLAVAGSATRFVDAQSVVVALAGQGKTKGMAARTELRATLNQSLAAIEPTAALDYRFLHYWLKSNYSNIRNLAGGDLRDGLNLDHIGSIEVPVPSPVEQRHIADYLDQETAEIDAFLADLERMNALVEERLISLASELTRRHTAEARQKLTWHYRIRNGLTPKSDNPIYWERGSIPWVNSSVVNREVVDVPSRLVTPTAMSELGLSMIPRGSLLVGLTGEGRTRGMVTQLAIDTTISQHVAALTRRSESSLSEDFTRLYLTAAYDKLRVRSAGNGGTKGAITCELLQQYKVPLPSTARQREVVARWAHAASDARAEKAEIGVAISLGKEWRAALITAAVTGRIDVTTRQKPVVESIQRELEGA